MERFCPTHSESISCSQFKAILARNLAENPALLKPCFLDFDICGAGEVTLEDLKIISGELGLYLSHSKLQAMISEFGKSKPGCITESEFALLAESIKWQSSVRGYFPQTQDFAGFAHHLIASADYGLFFQSGHLRSQAQDESILTRQYELGFRIIEANSFKEDHGVHAVNSFWPRLNSKVMLSRITWGQYR